MVLARFRRLTGGFHPAVLALSKVFDMLRITDMDAGALSSVFFGLLRSMAPASIPDTRLLEHSRTGFYWLLARDTAADQHAAERDELYTAIRLTCPISGVRLQVRTCMATAAA